MICLLLVFALSVHGQDVQIDGHFLADSVKIGEVIPFTLSARYPAREVLLFPDSTYDFSPFEIERKQFFPTVTREGMSFDSVVYFLSTYEIDPVQRLRLPVFVMEGKDSTVLYSESDSLILQQLVQQVPDSVSAQQLALKTNTGYQNVRWLFNYPILLVVIGIFIVLILIIWIFFGKKIQLYFALRKLNRHHAQFLSRFNEYLSRLQGEVNTMTAEAALTLWKGYMEQLLQQPYTKSTSKEILRTVTDPQLEKSLSSIDRMIYGGKQVTEAMVFEYLKDYSEHEYNKKKEEVKHG